jgi:hypothetical protein
VPDLGIQHELADHLNILSSRIFFPSHQHFSTMVDSLNLAGVIGTWVAVALALVALIGIVGPFLLLRETRSDRYKAVNAIDAKDTRYLSRGLKLPGSRGRLFMRVKAPLLSDAPGPNSFQVEEGNSRKDKKRLTNFSSTTGWIYLGLAIQTYSTGLRFGDSLIIRNQQSWLPVHRFWLLRIGLVGRYGHREDGGKKKMLENANRLRIEEKEEGSAGRDEGRRSRDVELDAEKTKWETSSSAERLSGLTGILWWRTRVSSQSESRIDEVYFSPHPVSRRQALYPDPIQLPHLFWLSLGCLPLTIGSTTVAYDLGAFLDSFRSRPRDQDGLTPVFSKFQPRGDIDNTGPYGSWASSVGADMSKVLCRQVVDYDSDTWFDLARAAEGEKGPWYALDSRLNGYLWRLDAQRMALAVVNLDLSPMGILFDKTRVEDDAVFTGSAGKVSILAHTLEKIVSPYIQDRFGPLLFFVPGGNFSRVEAEASYDIDNLNLRGLMDSLPPFYREIIGILTLTSKTFFAGLTDHAYIEVDVIQKVVRAPTITGEVMAHPFEFSELFPEVSIYHQPTTTRFENRPAILAAALAACLRGTMLEESMDSAKLIDTIQKMDNVIQVAASTSPPPLLQSETERRSPPSPIIPEYPEERQFRPRRQHNRILDQNGAAVGLENSGYPQSPGLPGDDGQPGQWREEDGDEADEIEQSPIEDYSHGERVRPVLTPEDEEEHLSDTGSVHRTATLRR